MHDIFVFKISRQDPEGYEFQSIAREVKEFGEKCNCYQQFTIKHAN